MKSIINKSVAVLSGLAIKSTDITEKITTIKFTQEQLDNILSKLNNISTNLDQIIQGTTSVEPDKVNTFKITNITASASASIPAHFSRIIEATFELKINGSGTERVWEYEHPMSLYKLIYKSIGNTKYWCIYCDDMGDSFYTAEENPFTATTWLRSNSSSSGTYNITFEILSQI